MSFRYRLTQTDRLPLATLLVITAVLFGAAVAYMFTIGELDYRDHLRFSQRLAEEGVLSNSHPLYQFITVAVVRLTGLSYPPAGILITTLCYVAGSLIVYRMIRGVIGERDARWWAAGIALALMLVSPILTPEWAARNLTTGYIPINVHHNPTSILLKPLALLLFMFAANALDSGKTISRRMLVAGVALTAVSLIAKPNFTMSLLPALVLLMAYDAYRRRPVNRAFATIIVTAILVLAAQYLYQFTVALPSAGVSFAPLRFVYLVEPSTLNLVGKFALSVAFPVCVYGLYFRAARKDAVLNLAWLVFFGGAAQLYLLIETGWQMIHGNFGWGAQMSLFVLFVITTMFLLQRVKDTGRMDWRALVCGGVFILHLVSGGVFYLIQLSPNIETFRSWFQ